MAAIALDLQDNDKDDSLFMYVCWTIKARNAWLESYLPFELFFMKNLLRAESSS
jgi:hypothetical protein